ncbi:MAG: alpha/beta hydrolase, partial [Steroidobacteraceae bacterium]
EGVMIKVRQTVLSGAVSILVGTAAVCLAANPKSLPRPGAALSQRPLPPNTPLGSGPFKSIIEQAPGLPDHTIYRPRDLAALGVTKLPIVAWGNGACADNGTAFRWFLSEIASYGFLVIANGPIGRDPIEFRLRGPITRIAPDKLPPPATHTKELWDAIDWAVAENRRPASPFHDRLAPDEIAVMGQSCGGVQAIEAGADPRIKTAVIWNSGLFPQTTTMGGGKTLTKQDLASLHSPIAYISGDAEDIAFANSNDDYRRLSATSLPVFRGYERGVTHGGTYSQPNGGEFGGVAVAWLLWQLRHDERAGRMFAGPECGLCVNPRWVTTKKNVE